ncbi:MAG: hypothetical protein IKC60_03740 [Clostridia bacterium]|nr:hypothetical protein [Clostridia bacterium]
MSVWSKLQKSLYQIIADQTCFQIHCSAYRMDSQRGGTLLPRYWITIEKDIVFDYPKQFLNEKEKESYPYVNQVSEISALIREYIDCPPNLLPEKTFENDLWGLTDILKSVDKRLGKERLLKYFKSPNQVIENILKKRFY